MEEDPFKKADESVFKECDEGTGRSFPVLGQTQGSSQTQSTPQETDKQTHLISPSPSPTRTQTQSFSDTETQSQSPS